MGETEETAVCASPDRCKVLKAFILFGTMLLELKLRWSARGLVTKGELLSSKSSERTAFQRYTEVLTEVNLH